MTENILNEDLFPITGWSGPGDAMIRPDVMRGMADAGFTVSHSRVSGGLDDVVHALDVAADSGVRLLLVHHTWHVGDDYVFDADRQVQVAALVDAVKNHPGLYGYHLRDEPRFHLLPRLAEVHAFIHARDPYHLCYINHFPPIEGWGAPTAEAFWWHYIEQVQPQMLSYDHYPIMVGSVDEIEAAGNAPNVIPLEKLIIKPDFFSCLELLRTLSNATRLPFWAFTCSVRHGPYPIPTEGHIRFQLMNDLAYGAQGLQYFTYAHSGALVRPDGTTTETWDIARRVNADIHKLGPVLRRLRNIGTFRTGPLWSGTQHLHRSHLAPLVACEGDPVTIGCFQDEAERLYLMVVNGSPCDWTKITLKVDVADGEKLLLFEPTSAQFHELWPADPRHQLITFAPGEGRLFKVGRTGLGVDF